jgi:HAD superfamily hydrolase (TIGR01509 family)
VTTPPLRWDEIDTVLLDMDGTLLDLQYDNVLWNEHLPERFARRHGLSVSAARTRLERHFDETRHTIEHYCLDYWTRFTQLDVIALHRDLTHLIRYRPHAERFLSALTATGRRSVLVTNAHRGSLDIKDEITSLTARLDDAVSAHDFRTPKESREFWSRLDTRIGFDPSRTLLIDDNAAVLDAAERYGIRYLLTVHRPDSSRPPRDGLEYAAFDTFDELLP